MNIQKRKSFVNKQRMHLWDNTRKCYPDIEPEGRDKWGYPIITVNGLRVSDWRLLGTRAANETHSQRTFNSLSRCREARNKDYERRNRTQWRIDNYTAKVSAK